MGSRGSVCADRESGAGVRAGKGRKRSPYRDRDTSSPFLLGQDTLYLGYIKGIGKIYLQTGIDTFYNMGFANICTENTAFTAADFLNDIWCCPFLSLTICPCFVLLPVEEQSNMA